MSDFCPLEDAHGHVGGILFLSAKALGRDGSTEGEEEGDLPVTFNLLSGPGKILVI